MPVWVQITGYIGAFFISVAFLPQTYKLLKTKDTKGLSLTSYLIYHVGLTFFIIYGACEEKWPLLAANVFGWVVNFILVALICYNIYQSKKVNSPKKEKKTTKKEKPKLNSNNNN